MKACNAYESGCMKSVLGETLRPGGFSLTETAVRYCGLTPADEVLDLGCGRGATVNYLHEVHGISAMGLDPSEKLIEEAKSKFGYAKFVQGNGESLSFEDKSFDCVFAECTLSLMDSLESVIKQVHRVMRDGGWFVISDVYAKNPEAVSGLKAYSINSCMRGLHDIKKLESKLEREGFSVTFCEDYSHFLKELVVKIGFSFGSMSEFWNITAENCIDGSGFYEKLKLCKPGYFLLIARKRGTACG